MLIFVGAIAACDGGKSSSTSSSSSGQSSQSVSITGRASKGPIIGGTVTVYQLNADGTRGAVLAQTTTGADGRFSFNQSFTGAVEIAVSGGSYVDEATGVTVDFAGKELQAMYSNGVAAGENVAVTAITTIATAQARQRINDGESMTAAITNANANIAANFGLEGVDITHVTPDDLTNGSEQSDPNSDSARYGLILAALSQSSANRGYEPGQLREVIARLERDLSDTKINEGRNQDVMLGLPAAAGEFLGNGTNASQITVGAINIPSPILNIEGCMDPSGSNWNPEATSAGDCTYRGCTNQSASNYNPTATVDDGSCAYTQASAGSSTPAGMVLVTGGCFDMGDNWLGEEVDELLHNVCVSTFYMDAKEVTQGDYTAWNSGVNPSWFVQANEGTLPADTSTYPVEKVTWQNASDYCSAQGKRLPTEAEWEYAARNGGQVVRYGTGSDNIDCTTANIWNGGGCYNAATSVGGGPAPVGNYAANSIGLYDMAGNMWEWVSDWYDANYYATSPVNDPENVVDSGTKIVRGGSWERQSIYARAADRVDFNPADTSYLRGFRCAQ
ncbi:MAG: SUMF1/EgtB/PvdO family nonheme iron enzyme [Nitrospinae bacterium]|nr:SUMF1/EgtB/PvdO family nonheme iron enzyme [Nitrospinota bacterium]